VGVYLRVVPYSTGEADMLDCAALSMGVRGRCFHGCFQSDSMSTFIWMIARLDEFFPSSELLSLPRRAYTERLKSDQQPA
jgi:hypothetical protein